MEKELVRELQKLFEEEFQNDFFSLLMQGNFQCMKALKAIEQFVGAKPLPWKLLLQMDNCVKDNKNRYLLAFLSFLTTRDVCSWVSLLWGTHEDIDGCFGYLSKKLRERSKKT